MAQACIKKTFVTVRLFATSRSVLGSPHCWRFHRVHPATRHDVFSSKQLVLAHEIELFLTSLLLGRHCHILVSLKESFRRRLRAVTHFMNLLRDCEHLNCFTRFCQYSFKLRSSSLQLIPLRSSQTQPIIRRCCGCSFRCSSFLQHFCTFQCFLCLRISTRIASRFERFTPDPEEGSCAIGRVSSELLCRFDSWSSRASSAPVSRSRFVVATGHIVSGTVVRRTRSLHSTECQPL